jgi:non-specific serine/threonine protein kinase
MFLGLGRILALQGLIGEARYWCGRTLDERGVRGLDGCETAEVLALAGLLAVLQEDLPVGLELLEQGERRALAMRDDARGLAYVRQVQGVAALSADRLDDAIDHLTQAGELHGQAGNDDVLVPISVVFLAGTCAVAMRIDEARRHAERVIRATEAAGEEWCRSYGLCVLGLTLALAGEPERAMDEVRAGLRIKRDLDDRLGIALAFDVAGLILVGLGDAPAAARLHGAADATLRFTGASLFGTRHRELRALYSLQAKEIMGEEPYRKAQESGAALPLDAAVRELLGEPAPTPAAPGPASATADPETPLTPRELEIAGLVTEGLTNREIAARLVIAKRTVDSHVEHILSKLTFTSRAQIAAWYSQQR